MGCKGCGGSRGARPTTVSDYPSMFSRVSENGIQTGTNVNDKDFVLCEYAGTPPGNISDQSVIGVTMFPDVLAGVPMIRRSDRSGNEGWSIDYRYRKAGDRFLVHKEDLRRSPNWFTPVEFDKKSFESVLPKQRTSPPPPPPQPESLAETLERAVQVPGMPGAPPAPVPQSTPFEQHAPVIPQLVPQAPMAAPTPVAGQDTAASEMASILSKGDLQALPGITNGIAEQMIADGVKSYKDILAKGTDGLVKYKGVAETRAMMIIDAITAMEAGVG